MAQSYEEKNNKYRKDIRNTFSYLTKEIQLDLILPHLHEILHHSDYELLRKRSQNNSDWDCNQELLSRLQKREYWWRAFREALVSIDRHNIIERLGWDENTFDFGPRHENTTVRQNSRTFSNPPENPEKPNKKPQPLEEITQQKLDVYKKQNELVKEFNPTRNENNQLEQSDVDPNLLSFEQKKLNTDFKTVENDLGKVLLPEIHPAVRRNLPLNFPSSDQEEKLSNYDASVSPFQSAERYSRDEVNANNCQTSNSPPSMDKISNSQSLRSIPNPLVLDHSMSAPTICTEPGAVFPPNHSSVRQTDIPVPTQNVSTSTIHHSLSAPSMNRALIPERQQHNSAGADQEVLRSKNEDDSYFESSINSAEQSTMFVRPTSNPGVANIEPSDGRSNAERQEMDLRQQNLELCQEIKDENGTNPNPGSSRSQNFEDGVFDCPTSSTAFQEIRPQTLDCHSNIASMTTIKPSLASTVDPTGVSRRGNVQGEKNILHKSLNLNREPDSYVTGLHSYGSDVTSSIRSGGQSSTLLSQEHDQTYVKTLGSITRVDALDNYNFNSSNLDSSSISSPDAMRLNLGSVLSAPSAADDHLTDPPGTEDLQYHNSSLAQSTSVIQDSASAQNLVGTMPNFDSLLSASNQSLRSIANQNSALSELPFAGNSNFPEFSELLSMGSAVDPAEYSEPGAFSPVSVAHPPSSGQLAELDRVSVNERQDHEGAGNAENADTALNDADVSPPSVFWRFLNSIGHSVENVFETFIPSSDCSQ